MGMGNRIPDSGYTFLKVSLNRLSMEAQHLWQENFEETGFLMALDLNVDMTRYHLLEQNGHLAIIAVIKDDIIVGYAALLNDRFLHSQHVHYVKIDTIFINKKYRSLVLFKRLLQYIETFIKSYNVKYLFMSSSIKRSLDKLLTKYDYKPIETLFYKELI
jgi:GNAT superfamily N-acetyltransferase